VLKPSVAATVHIFLGDIGEILIYTTALTTPQRQLWKRI